jgi:hypothetical protein
MENRDFVVADSKRHIDFLDYVRAIAIVAVFLFHSLGTACGDDQLPWGTWFREFSVSKSFLFLLPFSYGMYGVAVFFALEIVLRGICSVALIMNWKLPLGYIGVPLMYWFSWSVGAAVADAYVSGRPIPFANESIALWSGLALMSNFVKPLAPFSFLFFALLTVMAIAKVLRHEDAGIRPPSFLSRYLRRVEYGATASIFCISRFLHWPYFRSYIFLLRHC